jgi:hypothetical protein
MLDYVVQFVNNYAGLNKWAHVQSLAGHESSGTVVETLDADLRDCLKELMNSSDELLVILMADHGMRYGQWYKEQGGATEHKLPMLFMLASSSLLERVPSSLDVLSHNSRRLVSKLDLNRTLRHLAYLPYLSYTRASQQYADSRVEGASVSLLLEKISNTRSCADVLIPPFYCSCLEFYDTNLNSALAPALAQVALRRINSLAVTSFRTSQSVCRPVTLKAVTEISFQKASSKQHIYRLTMSINEHPSARFEACILLSTSHIEPPLPSEGYELEVFHYLSRMLLQVLYVRRTDSYAGTCEEVCKEAGLVSALCICSSLEQMEYKQPKILHELKQAYQFSLAQLGQDCNSHCSDLGSLCSEDGLALANTCNELWRQSRCTSCEAGLSAALPGISGSKCLKGRELTCEAADASVARVCACVGSS